MSNSQKNPNNQTINCTNASKNDDVCKQIDNDAVKQFKILVSIVFIGLIIYAIRKFLITYYLEKQLTRMMTKISTEKNSKRIRK